MRRPRKREYHQYQTLILIINQDLVKTEDAPARELPISLQPSPFATDPFCFRTATGSVGRRNQGEGHLGGSIRGEARRKLNCLCFIWSASVGIRGNERRRRNFLNWSFKMWISRRKQNRRRRRKFWGFRVPYCRFLTMFSFPERFPRPPRTVFCKIIRLRRAKKLFSAYGKSFGQISLVGKVLGETPTPKGEVAVSP